MTKYFLSIDVATKSLAVIFLKKNELNLEGDIEKELNNLYVFYVCEVIDLIKDKKLKDTTLIERSKKLNEYITTLKERINKVIKDENIKKIKMIIEKQPKFNDKSSIIQNQLVYAFCGESIYSIKLICPFYKNMVYLHKDLTYGKFIQKYKKVYTAAKNHTKFNFIYYLTIFDKLHLIKDIKKKNHDDIADAFMQVIAFNKIN